MLYSACFFDCFRLIRYKSSGCKVFLVDGVHSVKGIDGCLICSPERLVFLNKVYLIQ